ncbi:MAG: PAS domain-containing protein [Magnetovibrio sp.]|nr:PAS domain-containing protein [Magnetovibrio sp.]
MDVRYNRLKLERLGFDDLGWAYAYWRGKCQGRWAPAWPDIDLAAVPPPVLPRVCVIDVKTAPTDFVYRFWGTRITDMHHYDLTGRSVRRLTPPEYAECIWRQYLEVYETKSPAAFLTEVPLDIGAHAYYAVVRMPLSADLETVDTILSVEQYGDQSGELKEIFEKQWRDDQG